jgi:hypothetical protein
MLSAIGWKTPSVSWLYDFHLMNSDKSRFPAPRERDLLVLTRRRHAQIAKITLGPDCDILIKRTQNFMVDLDLDWCVLALGIDEDEVTAYGLQTELPENLSTSVAGELVGAAISAVCH